ncbi:MAG TPA: hypothetical protein VFZ52_01215 [Chryseolinea sp.]
MKIKINDKEVDYISDYPTGWKFSAGDPYKFPVLIEGQACFVKRFQTKSAADITGWGLLQRLKGRKESNLPTIYDIVEVTEGEKKITYVFYEHIRGGTLEQSIIAGGIIRFPQTADHVLKALESIHAHGFWFPDFCEKNIFCEPRGRVMLVDLDSTVPLDTVPSNDLYGSKDYWIPVYQFFKVNLQQPGMTLSNLHGLSLNYLQSIFLVLHLKQYIAGQASQYKSDESFNKLPELLERVSPSSLNLFREVAQQSPHPLSNQSLEGVKMIIREIINYDLQKGPDSKPEILEFTSSKEWLEKGEPFTLSWKINGANKLELYRNGFLLTDIDPSRTVIERKEFYDDDKDVRYQLYAYQNKVLSKSDEVVIRLQVDEQGPGKRWGLADKEISQLSSIAAWSKFIGITSLVILVTLCIIAYMLEEDIYSDFIELIEMMILFFVVINIFPTITLLRLSNQITRGVHRSDVVLLNRGLRSLGHFFIYTAILIIILMVVGLILLSAIMAKS